MIARTKRIIVRCCIILFVLLASLLTILGVIMLVGNALLGNLSFFHDAWTLEETENYLTGPLPKDATDIKYQSTNGYDKQQSTLGVYEYLSFNAPPQSALDFANRICYSILLPGYDPFSAKDDGSAANGFLIQKDSEDFYYSYSPYTPKYLIGNRCYHLMSGTQEIMVDTTNPNLYKVKFADPRGCSGTVQTSDCKGYDLHLIHYEDAGTLDVGGAPRTIESAYTSATTWQISVKPSTKYEVLVKLVKPSINPVPGNLLHLWVDAFTKNEDDSKTDAVGPATTNGLRSVFVGPDDGAAQVNIFWLGNPGTCTIEVHEIKS